MGQEYLQTARAKGLRDAEVRRRHAVPNAMLPTTTLIFLNLGFVIGGAITIEYVFSLSGLGSLTVQALRGPDIPLLQTLFLLFSAAVILANLVADLHLRPSRSASADMTDATATFRLARSVGAPAARSWNSWRAVSPITAGHDRSDDLRNLRRDRTARAGPFDESQLDVTKATGGTYEAPSGRFWLGTDDAGRNVLAMMAWGARISLLVGLCATVLAMVIGTAVGIASGHYRGLVAGVLNRITDWFLVIPFLPLAIVLATVLRARVCSTSSS